MISYTSEPQRKTSYRNTSLRIVENHVDPPSSTNFNKRSPFFLKKKVPLYRESKLQIPTKTIEYMEVKEHSLLMEIVYDFMKIFIQICPLRLVLKFLHTLKVWIPPK